MKKFKFKDGSIITASSVEEAKSKHKVLASKEFIKEEEDIIKLLEGMGFKEHPEDSPAYEKEIAELKFGISPFPSYIITKILIEVDLGPCSTHNIMINARENGKEICLYSVGLPVDIEEESKGIDKKYYKNVLNDFISKAKEIAKNIKTWQKVCKDAD